jgi:hypothetical protein
MDGGGGPGHRRSTLPATAADGGQDHGGYMFMGTGAVLSRSEMDGFCCSPPPGLPGWR